MNSAFKSSEGKDKRWFVLKLPTSANPKIISEALNYVKSKAGDKSVYLFATDSEQGKVAHGCYMSKDTTGNGASPNEWSGVVSNIIGGKAGGKAPTSMGSGSYVDKVDAAIVAATEYMEKLQL